MNDDDNTCLGLFLLSLAFWLITSGASLSSIADAAQTRVQAQDSQRVETLVTAK